MRTQILTEEGFLFPIEDLKKEVQKQGFITFNGRDENDLITVWFNSRFQHFSIELNCKFIKVTKGWNPILNTLKERFL